MSEFIELSIFTKLFGKKPKAAIFDIDGTLASVKHRDHFVESPGGKDWSSFHGHMAQDNPVPEMVAAAKAHKAAGDKIIIVSLRPERYMSSVDDWLYEFDIPHDEIHLRPSGDYRRGVDVKRSIYHDLIEPRYDVVASYDDNPKMAEMWAEELGPDKSHQPIDPGIPPNLDVPALVDPKYPHGRPIERVLGDSPQESLFDQPETSDLLQYKTANMFQGWDGHAYEVQYPKAGVSPAKRVGSRVYVPPYARTTETGDVIHVDGYWRELSNDSAVDRLLLKLISA